MKKLLFILVTMAIAAACTQKNNSKMDYPETRKDDVTDVYFDTEIADPYRWLEDDMSAETGAWVKEQNLLTFSYLEKLPLRDQIRERLTKMWNYEKISAPFIEGEFTYYYRNDGLQNQSVLYRQKGDGEAEVFLDPNTFAEDGTTSLAGLEFSKDGSLAAYAISEGGSDWRKIIVRNTSTMEFIGDTIIDVKFSGISWKGNDGFYYSSYDKPVGSELSALTDHHKLYYHKLGTPQSADVIVFGADIKRRYVGGGVTEDGKYLVVSAAISTTGNELYIQDLTKANSKLVNIVPDFEKEHNVITTEGTTLYIYTNLNAPNGRIVKTDFSKPGRESWVDVIPETDNVLEPSTGSGFIFAHYMVDAISKVKQFNLAGEELREITLPGVGRASGFGGKIDQEKLYYTFTNYITPPSIYSLEPVEGTSELYKKPAVDFNGDNFESVQVFFDSKDGTRIPMVITYKKGIKLNGKNPTILYGYGGFGISQTPGFSVTNALWLEMGGVYAVANLRGGGEYGENWHLAGIKMKKQNVFDDFIAAGEYLIANNYTTPAYLAIRGGSNGGLLVGAVMAQRPDLMQVALPAVGVMDMLRYHKFTSGAGWAYDYGTSEESKEMFEYILGYSPVHTIKPGVSYPATLVTTGDHDDRVVPAHSFKFAAQLQASQAGNNPTLIRIETNAGHGAGTPVSKTIDLYADIFSFTLHNMGVTKIK